MTAKQGYSDTTAAAHVLIYRPMQCKLRPAVGDLAAVQHKPLTAQYVFTDD